MMKIHSILLSLFFVNICYSMEADNYTYKDTEKLKDSSNQFNKIVNSYIYSSIKELNRSLGAKPPLTRVMLYTDKALETVEGFGIIESDCHLKGLSTISLNQTEEARNASRRKVNTGYKLPKLPSKLRSFNAPFCDRDKLYRYLKSNLDRNWPAARVDMLRDNSISKGKVNESDGSVYENSATGILMSLGGCCDPLVNVDNNYVGIDKLDHFLGHGAVYFEEYRENFSIKNVLKIGEDREVGGWGLSGTGVKSYGDAAANYAGLHFWTNLLDGENPYIKCENGQFEINRQFDVRNFVTPAMDESINCSSFKSLEISNAVDSYAESVGLKKKCPTVPKACKDLTRYYSKLEQQYLLHPRCRNSDVASDISLANENSDQGIIDTLKDFWNGI